jgi:hypothetical protein
MEVKGVDARPSWLLRMKVQYVASALAVHPCHRDYRLFMEGFEPARPGEYARLRELSSA